MFPQNTQQQQPQQQPQATLYRGLPLRLGLKRQLIKLNGRQLKLATKTTTGKAV
jgi:hypothetical protein